MTKFQSVVFKSVNDYRSIIPRLIVGLVFFSEGIQKFLFPELVGAGRFEKIGFTNPEFLAALVASFEVICGVLMLIGFSVRVAAIPLLIIMITAITTTKIPILQEKGFWQMAHDSRTDFAMTMLIIFLLIYGAGKLSVDYLIKQKFISA
ncbi:MAG: DoxX family protein [Bacteroidales bacterium]